MKQASCCQINLWSSGHVITSPTNHVAISPWRTRFKVGSNVSVYVLSARFFNLEVSYKQLLLHVFARVIDGNLWLWGNGRQSYRSRTVPGHEAGESAAGGRNNLEKFTMKSTVTFNLPAFMFKLDEEKIKVLYPCWTRAF